MADKKLVPLPEVWPAGKPLPDGYVMAGERGVQEATLSLIAKMTTAIDSLVVRMDQTLEPDVARCKICDHPVSEHAASGSCSHLRCRCDQKP